MGSLSSGRDTCAYHSHDVRAYAGSHQPLAFSSNRQPSPAIQQLSSTCSHFCAYPIRLKNNAGEVTSSLRHYSVEGSVEVRENNIWSTVCNDNKTENLWSN